MPLHRKHSWSDACFPPHTRAPFWFTAAMTRCEWKGMGF